MTTTTTKENSVAALADMLSDRDRQRLLERMRELRGLDGLMRESGTLPSAPEPPPLHRSRDAGREAER